MFFNSRQIYISLNGQPSPLPRPSDYIYLSEFAEMCPPFNYTGSKHQLYSVCKRSPTHHVKLAPYSGQFHRLVLDGKLPQVSTRTMGAACLQEPLHNRHVFLKPDICLGFARTYLQKLSTF